MSNQGTLAR